MSNIRSLTMRNELATPSVVLRHVSVTAQSESHVLKEEMILVTKYH